MSQTGRKRIFLILQTACCILLAVLLAAGAVEIWTDGSARKILNPLAGVYTPDAVAEKLGMLLPLFLVSALLAVLCAVFRVRDETYEKPAGKPFRIKQGHRLKHTGLIQAVLVAAAAALIIAGILNGSARDVLIKAIHICTECIGLG